MKRRLALARWRLLWSLVGLAGCRTVVAIVFWLAGVQEAIPETARLVAATVFDLALVGLAIVVLVAFVQHGRIYNARIPTE